MPDDSGTVPSPALPETMPDTDRWLRRGGLAMLAVGYASAVVVSAVAAAFVAAATGDVTGLASRMSGQLAFWAMLVGCVLWVHCGKSSQVSVGLRPQWIDVPLGVIIGMGAQLVLIPALYLPLRKVIDERQVSAPASDLFDGVTGPGLVVLGVSVIVLTPLVEELFFRGALLNELRQRWGTAVAVAGSSAIFGATHFQPLQFPALTLAGVVFSLAVVRTGRLGAAIAFHAGFNATTFVALALL